MPDVTNKTWEDIFKEIILAHGQVGVIIVIGIITLLLGGVIVWFYLTKFKYVSVNTQLERLKQENGQLTKNLDEANDKINGLESKIKKLEAESQDIQEYRFVRQSIKPDSQDESLKVFIDDTNNIKKQKN